MSLSLRSCSAAALALALVAALPQAGAATLDGQTVTITFAGTAPATLALPGFGTISSAVVGPTVELQKSSNPSAYALFGNGNISFDLTGDSLSIVYQSGSGSGASKVEDMAFSVALNNPLLAFAGAPTQVFDFFESRTLGGQGWQASLLNPQTMSFNLLDLQVVGSTGSAYTTGAQFNFGLNTVAAVPEAGSFALMLAGLAGVSGWSLRQSAALRAQRRDA